MRVALPLVLLAAVPVWQAPLPPDLHVVVRAEFVYMANTRVTSTEGWASEKKSMTRQGDRLSIVREDLGVAWRASVKEGTYTERPLPPAGTPAAPPPPAKAAIDMRTAGFEWEPAYDWSVKATGQTSTVAGRACREFAAAGDADYAEARASFWACEPLPGVGRSPNDAVVAALYSPSTRRMILDTLAKEGGAWVLAAEEQQEPAIAPTIVMRVRVETLEAGAAPPGTFDLPPSFKKAGR